MANNHAHGAFAELEMLAADGTTRIVLTPHVNGFNLNKSVDNAEDTSLKPAGDFKSYLQGLRSGTSDFTLMPPDDGSPLFAINAILDKPARNGTTIYYYPFGKVTGKYMETAKGLFTNPGSISVSNSGAVTAPVGLQITGNPVPSLVP